MYTDTINEGRGSEMFHMMKWISLGILFAGVPLVLLVVHGTISTTSREVYAFSYNNPTIRTTWTASVLHASWDHTTQNIIGYICIVTPLYMLYSHWQKTELFWLLALSIVFIIPPVQHSADYIILHVITGAVPEQVYSVGFSNIVSGLVGVLVATIPWYVSSIKRGKHKTQTSVWLLTAIGIILLGNHTSFLPSVIISLVSIIIVTIAVVKEKHQSAKRDPLLPPDNMNNTVGGEWTLIWWVSVSAVIFMALLFPKQVIRSNGVVNVLGHFTSLLLGVVVTSMVISVEKRL